jgi:hypothetical protein
MITHSMIALSEIEGQVLDHYAQTNFDLMLPTIEPWLHQQKSIVLKKHSHKFTEFFCRSEQGYEVIKLKLPRRI